MTAQAESDRLQKPEEQRESIGNLIKDLAYQSAELVRDEVALARQELQEKIESLRSSFVLITVGSLVGSIALCALCAALVIGVAEYVTLLQSTLIVGGALAVTAFVIITTGVRRLSQTNLKPEQTIRTLEENKQWLKEIE